jgi:GT2 family glycosyltransferase
MTINLKASKIFIGALCRDASPYLADFQSFLSSLKYHASSYSVVVVQNDSSDKSHEKLQLIASKFQPFFDYICPGSLDSEFPERTDRLAFCRNLLLSRFRELGGSCVYDLVLMLDISSETSDITPQSINYALRTAPLDWAVLTANHSFLYYDIWALRHPMWCPSDVISDYHNSRLIYGDYIARLFSMGSRQIHIPPTLPPFLVESAFAGAAIYKAKYLDSITYSGADCYGNIICEHVEFHENIRANGGAIYIHPGFIVSHNISEHTFFSIDWITFNWIFASTIFLLNKRRKSFVRICGKITNIFLNSDDR